MGNKMNFFKKSSLALIIVFSMSTTAQADEAIKEWGVILPTIFASHDSESFDVLKVGTGVLPVYQNGQNYWGINAVRNLYSAPNWSTAGTQANLLKRDINPQTGLGYNLAFGVSEIRGSNLVTADLNYSASITSTTNYEVFFNRDRVETQNSLLNGVSYNFYGGAIENRILPNLTLIGFLGQQQFSDDNSRTHFKAKLIYDLFPNQGINLQLRHRQYHDSSDLSINYFNPRNYQEDMLAIGLRERIASWQLSGLAGLGRQKISEDPQTTTRLVEFEAVSPIANRIFFKAKAGYSESAGFNGPNYKYQYLQGDLIFAF
jgi:hypothetical protein